VFFFLAGRPLFDGTGKTGIATVGGCSSSDPLSFSLSFEGLGCLPLFFSPLPLWEPFVGVSVVALCGGFFWCSLSFYVTARNPTVRMKEKEGRRKSMRGQRRVREGSEKDQRRVREGLEAEADWGKGRL